MPSGRSTGTTICIVSLLAVSMCRAAVERKADDAEFQSLLKRGFELHQQARFTEAIPLLEHARRLEPEDYFANLLLGIDLLRTGKATEALPRLELAARVRPGEDTPEEYIGEAEASLDHYAQAAEAYQRALNRGEPSDEALEAWAGFALERFRQMGESLRASPAGIANVHHLQESAAKPASALTCTEPIPTLERKLAAQSPIRAVLAEKLATAYKLSICYAIEAGNAAARLQANGKNGGVLHLLRGDVLLRLKTDATAAEEEYRAAITLRPGDPAPLARLAEAELTAGDTASARESAQAALAIDPHRRDALRTVAFISMSNREYDQAIPLLRQLAHESPGDRSVQVELGRALAQTGQSDEALRHLGPALAGGYPDEKGALHALEARALRALGREDEAAKASAEAKRLSDAFQASSNGKANANQ